VENTLSGVGDTRGHRGRQWRVKRLRVTVVKHVGSEGRQIWLERPKIWTPNFMRERRSEKVVQGADADILGEKSHKKDIDRSPKTIYKASKRLVGGDFIKQRRREVQRFFPPQAQ